jgi:manganese oxidase
VRVKISAVVEPRSQREVMLGALLVILVPLVALIGLIAGQHLPAVASAPATSSPAPHLSGTMPGMDMSASAAPVTAEQMDSQMAQATKAFPAKTQGLGGQVLQPTVQRDGTKQYELTAAITPWEVSPGRIVQAWAYNGTVPGPTIHVNVGDKVRVVLHNTLPESTVIHFHGLTVPNAMDGVPEITQPPVKPGQSFTYEFTAQGPAVAIYHSHHDASKQVPAGMWGAFLVGEEPLPNGVKPSQEVPMVLNDAGPLGLSLNGKSFPATAPVVAKLGDWILVHYYNEGLQIHPMHLHGMPGMVVAKDGYPLASPYMADTILVAPGERYSVLIHADQPGTWAWHCHILTHAENSTGMFGMVTALIVK